MCEPQATFKPLIIQVQLSLTVVRFKCSVSVNRFPFERESEEETRKPFVLGKSVALETFVQCFQFKILNDILFLNTRLQKIGRIRSDL